MSRLLPHVCSVRVGGAPVKDMTVIGCQDYGRACAGCQHRTGVPGRCRALRRLVCGTAPATQPATVDTLVAYVRPALAAEHAPATVRRRLAGIAATHRAAGLASPIDDRVRLAVASATWTHRRRRRDTEPLDVASLRRMSAALPRTAPAPRTGRSC